MRAIGKAIAKQAARQEVEDPFGRLAEEHIEAAANKMRDEIEERAHEAYRRATSFEETTHEGRARFREARREELLEMTEA